MNDIAGPSHADAKVSVFSTQLPIPVSTVTANNSSYYSSIEPEFHWLKPSIKYLIDLVAIHFDEFYDKTLKKKVLWRKIAEKMRRAGFNCTSENCSKKWRNIKKSYITVLQKQVQGDFSSKFSYFDQMHAFLGKEIDPLGMREQGLNKAIQEKEIVESTGFPRVPFYEVTEDDNFEWSESAVHLLLDLILEHKDIFKVSSDIDSVWESISDRMSMDGYIVLPQQCQRKWVNLSMGFRHYQAEGEASGIPPKWPYFSRVRHVINMLNVPITITMEEVEQTIPKLKGSLTTPAVLREPPRRRKRRREAVERRFAFDSFDDADEGDDEEELELDDSDVTPRRFDVAMKRLQRSLNLEERLGHLEARMECVQKQKAAAKHSNNMLGLILGELKRINRSLEERKAKEAKTMKVIEERRVHDDEDDDDDDIHVGVGLSLKEDQMLLNHVDEDTPIVDEAACRQAILNMHNITDFEFVKTPKIELVDGSENEGIIIVEGV